MEAVEKSAAQHCDRCLAVEFRGPQPRQYPRIFYRPGRLHATLYQGSVDGGQATARTFECRSPRARESPRAQFASGREQRMNAPVRIVDAEVLGDIEDFNECCAYQAWFLDLGIIELPVV